MWVQNGHSNTFFKVHPAAALLVNPWPQNNTKYQEQQQADSVKDCGLSPAGQVRLGAGRVRTGTSDNSEITFWKQNTITRHDPNCHHRYLTSRAIIVSLSACLWPFFWNFDHLIMTNSDHGTTHIGQAMRLGVGCGSCQEMSGD